MTRQRMDSDLYLNTLTFPMGMAKKEDYNVAEVDVTGEDTEDRNNWRWKIRCGDP